MSLKASRKVISWLKSLDGRSPTVLLTWETSGHLTLAHWDSGVAQATIRVPVIVSSEDQPPSISFAPRYLAEALAIGPSGCYCVIMPCRLTGAVEDRAQENPSDRHVLEIGGSEN